MIRACRAQMIALMIALMIAVMTVLALPHTAQADDRDEPIIVFAAASLTGVLQDHAANWAAQHQRPMPRLAFGASATMARQIVAGAPADLFLSANPAWARYLVQEGKLTAAPSLLVKNRLVLIKPRDQATPAPGELTADLVRATIGTGRLAMADPQAAPAGDYAQRFLIHIGLWAELAGNTAFGQSVRQTLLLTEKGGMPSFVYATDARASRHVTIVGTVPEDAIGPIHYMAGTVTDDQPDTAAFLAYLTSAPAAPIWGKYGFEAIVPN